MDEADQAYIFTQRYLQGEIAKASGTNSTRASMFFCEECGDVIPEGRRKAIPGCTLCVNCQTEIEAEGVAG